jgi:hypothetical protein
MPRLLKTQIESSSLASVIYDPEDLLLEVVFRRTGHIYDFFDVPRATYDALMAASSKGAFLNQVIKPRFEHIRVDFPIG